MSEAQEKILKDLPIAIPPAEIERMAWPSLMQPIDEPEITVPKVEGYRHKTTITVES